VVSRAAQPDQQIVSTTLAQLERITQVPAPSILLTGECLRETRDLDVIAEYVADAVTHQPPMEL
jgi:siroheme synthase